MSKDAPVTQTLRITQTSRDPLQQAAEQDRRSMANMVEVLILNHCRNQGISVDAKRKTGSRQARRSVRQATKP